MKPKATPDSKVIETLMAESAARHRHLCPRQILGIRIGLAGLLALDLIDPDYQPRFNNQAKRLLTIVETDGCGADGVAVATDCVVGRRTLRVLDFGKVAATLVDTSTGSAVRLAPAPGIRTLAIAHAPPSSSQWQSYLAAYQTMPDADLLRWQKVTLTRSLADILSKPGLRVCCDLCGEEIMNQRELRRAGKSLCRACAGDGYYQPL